MAPVVIGSIRRDLSTTTSLHERSMPPARRAALLRSLLHRGAEMDWPSAIASGSASLLGVVVGAPIVGRGIAGVLKAVVGQKLNEDLERLRAELGKDIAKEVEQLRAAAAKDLAEQRQRHEVELEAQRTAALHAIEGVKAELSVMTKLKTGAEEKRAQVAAEVLVATLRFLYALEGAVTLAALGDAPPGSRPEVQVSRSVDMRRKVVDAATEQLTSAWILAEVHLPDDVNQLLDSVWKLWADIHAAQATWAAAAGTTEAGEYYRRSVGPDPEKRINEMRSTVKTRLRQLVLAPTVSGRAPGAT
jgi:hypothetical protein